MDLSGIASILLHKVLLESMVFQKRKYKLELVGTRPNQQKPRTWRTEERTGTQHELMLILEASIQLTGRCLQNPQWAFWESHSGLLESCVCIRPGVGSTYLGPVQHILNRCSRRALCQINIQATLQSRGYFSSGG